MYNSLHIKKSGTRNKKVISCQFGGYCLCH